MALPADPSKSVHSAGKLVQQDMPHFQRDHALFNPYEHGLCDEEGRAYDQRMDPEFWVPPNAYLGKVNATPQGGLAKRCSIFRYQSHATPCSPRP